VTGHGASIVQERILDATPEEVFAAWCDPVGMQAWMCPRDDVARATVELDFRVGGRFRIAMHGTQDYDHHGEYLVIDPPQRLVFTWVSVWMPAAIAATRVTVSIAPAGRDGARLTLVHEELPNDESYQGHVDGWASILAKLAAHLAARKD
jgi:uncharacterized protein YndB with AHSA1/START domain